MKKLNTFLNQPSEQEFNFWYCVFVRDFPFIEPFTIKNEDWYNAYIGRVLSVLDELGETDDFFKYINPKEAIKKNYELLLDKLVEKEHPEMYKEWIEVTGRLK